MLAARSVPDTCPLHSGISAHQPSSSWWLNSSLQTMTETTRSYHSTPGYADSRLSRHTHTHRSLRCYCHQQYLGTQTADIHDTHTHRSLRWYCHQHDACLSALLPPHYYVCAIKPDPHYIFKQCDEYDAIISLSKSSRSPQSSSK